MIKTHKKRYKKRKTRKNRNKGGSIDDIRDTFTTTRLSILPGSINPVDVAQTRLNLIKKNKEHMDKLYPDVNITPLCESKKCICRSDKNNRINTILEILNKDKDCDACDGICDRTKKILEMYKNLNNADLKSLPYTYIKFIRSRFPAYFHGYMTSTRINKLIKYILDNENSYNVYENTKKELQYLKYKNVESLSVNYIFDIKNKIFYSLDSNGNMKCNDSIHKIQKSKIDCNNVLTQIKNLNNELTHKTKKFILFNYEGEDILILVNKSIFTQKYIPKIIDIEIKMLESDERDELSET